MRCDHALRIALAMLASTSLVGCRGFSFRHHGCSTCGSSVGAPFVVSDSIVSDGHSYVADTGCTTCQKSFSSPAESYAEEADEPLMADASEPLMLPTDMPQQSFSVKPTPDEQPLRPEANTPEPVKPLPVEKPPAIPTTPPTTSATPRPAGINVDVRSSMSVAMVGQEVAFDVAISNAGGSSIDSVDLAVIFSDGLRPKSVSPEGVARIEGQRVIFDQVRRFAPMTLNYRVVAEATAGMPESRMTLEVTSPILTSGPIKRETVVRITP
jgi:hypothetical protein